jgi:hypothetical protein
LIFEASEFVFKAPAPISRARRVLIKPHAGLAELYPVSTSREILTTIIEGIREVSDADIIILEGNAEGGPIAPVYEALKYDFPRVLKLDVKDSIWVEVDNPLPKPLAVPTFWVPNVILSSDYLISVAPLQVLKGRPNLTLTNLLSLLPTNKYGNKEQDVWSAFQSLGIDKVIADLYFTLPFDLGIIEARKKYLNKNDSGGIRVEEVGKIFMGEPFKVDSEAAGFLGLKAEYLNLINTAKVGFEI